jgi:RNA polymerase sigma-70 factor, ECF subfamily
MSGEEQHSAVAEAYRSHAGLVERALRRAGVAERDLSDARQEVFIVVHRRLAEFEGRASLSTWLYRIALNVASDHRRSAYQRRERLDAGAASERERDDGEAHCVPDERLEQRELLAHALRALERLDPDKREAFVLAELYGLSMRDVAAQLGCPQKTAFSRTYAARRRILEELHRLGALPLLPLLLPLRALRGLRLHPSGPAALAPAAALVPVVAVSALVVAGVWLAVAAGRVPAVQTEPAATRMEEKSFGRQKTPADARADENAGAEKRAVAVVANEAANKGERASADGVVRKARRAQPVAASAVPVESEVIGEHEDDMLVVRSGAVDVRPQFDHPLAAGALLPAPSAPPRIRVRGPSDPADGVEQALDADPLFAYPIARD